MSKPKQQLTRVEFVERAMITIHHATITMRNAFKSVLKSIEDGEITYDDVVTICAANGWRLDRTELTALRRASSAYRNVET